MRILWLQFPPLRVSSVQCNLHEHTILIRGYYRPLFAPLQGRNGYFSAVARASTDNDCLLQYYHNRTVLSIILGGVIQIDALTLVVHSQSCLALPHSCHHWSLHPKWIEIDALTQKVCSKSYLILPHFHSPPHIVPHTGSLCLWPSYPTSWVWVALYGKYPISNACTRSVAIAICTWESCDFSFLP